MLFWQSLSTAFVKRYLTTDKCNAVLQVTDGGLSWPVKCCLDSTYNYAKLTRGWKAFAQDNRLVAVQVMLASLS